MTFVYIYWIDFIPWWKTVLTERSKDLFSCKCYLICSPENSAYDVSTHIVPWMNFLFVHISAITDTYKLQKKIVRPLGSVIGGFNCISFLETTFLLSIDNTAPFIDPLFVHHRMGTQWAPPPGGLYTPVDTRACGTTFSHHNFWNRLPRPLLAFAAPALSYLALFRY